MADKPTLERQEAVQRITEELLLIAREKLPIDVERRTALLSIIAFELVASGSPRHVCVPTTFAALIRYYDMFVEDFKKKLI